MLRPLIMVLAVVLGMWCPTVFADSRLTVSAKIASSSKITVKVTITDSTLKTGTLRLERSINDGTFAIVAQFAKLKRTSSFTDTDLIPGTYAYRARVESGKLKTRWVRSAPINLSSGGGGTPGPVVTATPTTAPTATPRASTNFDADGNVTPTGKAIFGIPSTLTANKTVGSGIWSGTCRACHSTEKTNYNFIIVRSAVRAPPMSFTSAVLSDQSIADVVAYLNRFRDY